MDLAGDRLCCWFFSYLLVAPLQFVWAQNATLASYTSLQMLDSGEIRSHNFPRSCCEAQTFTLQLDPSTSAPAYIHLNFDDLDLPPGTYLRIYRDEEETSLYVSQPSIKFGVWIRPSISTEGGDTLIRIVIRPTSTSQEYNSSHYVGFKASYIVMRSATPAYPLTDLNSELCQRLASAREGGQIRVSPLAGSRYDGLWLDCLWVLKPPLPQEIGRFPMGDLRIYARLDTNLHIDRGKIEIRNGNSSEAPILASGKDLASLAQPADGFVSSQGLHIRALLPANKLGNKLKFVYGYMSYLAREGDIELCDAEHQICDAPYTSWCVPQAHVCNQVYNCPAGGDEECSASMTTTTTPKPTTTSPRTTTTSRTTTTRRPCLPGEMECPSGPCAERYIQTCYDVDNGCDSERSKYCKDSDTCQFLWRLCPGECEGYEKKCDDGQCISSSKYCPEDPCPSYEPNRCNNNRECYSDAEKCDDDWDCNDGTDENNCDTIARSMKNFGLNWIYVAIFVPAVLIVCVLLCNRKSKKRGQNSPGSGDEEQGATRLQPLPSHTPQTPQTGYVAVATTDAGGSGPDSSSPDTQAPPPSYDEVASSGRFPPPQQPPDSQPPPPSYETVAQNL